MPESEVVDEDHAVPRTICLLKKHWKPCPRQPCKKLNRIIGILTTQETKEIATLLSKHFHRTCILDLDHLKSQLQKPQSTWKNFDGFVDLVGCGAERNESLTWIRWLQYLIERGHKEGLVILCVTRRSRIVSKTLL